MLKLLALARQYRLHREQVFEYLWPDLDLTAAANNLRVTLHFARKLLDQELALASRPLQLQGDLLVLLPEHLVWTDVAAFETAAQAARGATVPSIYRAALDLYVGELLPEDRFEDWAVERRSSLHATYLTLLEELAHLHEERNEPAQAIPLLRRVIECDPINESAHLGLMRLYLRVGRRVEALRQYQQLRELLQRDLGIAPDSATTNLYETILAGTDQGVPFTERDRPQRSSVLLPSGRADDRHVASQLTNLPAQITSFIGREREIALVCEMLERERLVTLTGPGGSGKTRLAIEIARAMAHQFEDGVWLVELAGLTDPAVVPYEVAMALDIHETGGRSVIEALISELANDRLLLILDNCEHLIDACAEFVHKLLQHCSGLTVLTTSREALRIDGEMVQPVPAMNMPDPRSHVLLDELGRIEAVQLFSERARMARAGFTVTGDNAEAVATICRRLEGMPLAIELAASRVRVMSAQQIASRLDDALKLLSIDRRSGSVRQHSLSAAIGWSYELLSEDERRLFRRLSVFAGSVALEAAEWVCADDDPEADTILDGLFLLVEKSLILTEERVGEVRYRLLEMIRQFGMEQLAISGEVTTVCDRHVDWFLRLVSQAEPELWGANQVVWLNRLETEHDNLRAALAWTIERRDADRGLALGWQLWRFWSIRGYLSEGRRWLDLLLELPETSGSATSRAEALFGAGRLAYLQGDSQSARCRFEECLMVARGIGHDELVASALTQLGHLLFRQGEYPAARVRYAEGLNIRRDQAARQGKVASWYLAVSLTGLGKAALAEGDIVEACARLEESLALYRAVGDKVETAHTLFLIGQAIHQSGDLIRARQIEEESLAMARMAGNQRVAANALTQLAAVVADQGDIRGSEALFGEALMLWQTLGIELGIAECLEGFAGLAGQQGRHDRALRLAAAAHALRRTIGDALIPSRRAWLAASLKSSHDVLVDRSTMIQAEGEAMTLEQAVAYALTDVLE